MYDNTAQLDITVETIDGEIQILSVVLAVMLIAFSGLVIYSVYQA